MRRRSKATGVVFDIVQFQDGSALAVIAPGQADSGSCTTFQSSELDELFEEVDGST